MAKSHPSLADTGSDRVPRWCLCSFGQKSRTSCGFSSRLKPFLLLPLALSVWVFRSAHGESRVHDAPAALVSRTFHVLGVECGSCVYLVEQAVREVPGVSRVNVVQSLENCADVTFDPKVVSEHQIAQAVFTAHALHGTPYRAALRMRMPDYVRQEKKMTALFERWNQWVELQVVDREKGELAVHFLPLKTGAQNTGIQGWSLARFLELLKEVLPAGAVLEVQGTGAVGG